MGGLYENKILSGAIILPVFAVVPGYLADLLCTGGGVGEANLGTRRLHIELWPDLRERRLRRVSINTMVD